jgi:hypothetical protein
MNQPAIESVREKLTNVLPFYLTATRPAFLSAILAARMLGYALLLTLIMIGNMP